MVNQKRSFSGSLAELFLLKQRVLCAHRWTEKHSEGVQDGGNKRCNVHKSNVDDVDAARLGERVVALIKWTEEAGQITLGLPGDLDLPMAPALVDSLRHAFAVGDSIMVLADAVERISTACIQALVAAGRHATDHSQRFAIVAPSETVIEACSDLGLESWLKQWSHE